MMKKSLRNYYLYMTGCLRIIFPGKLQYEVCFIKKNLVGEERRAVGAHIDADCLLDNSTMKHGWVIIPRTNSTPAEE
jgi:hypothetical protein